MNRNLRRRFVIVAHWATALLLAVVLIKGPWAAPLLVSVFAGISLVWFASYLVGKGPLGRPGPKLSGTLSTVHRAQHHTLYWAVAVSGIASVSVLEHSITGRALTVLLFLGLLHGVFHLWRHTALFDGALKTIMPRFLHEIL